MATENTGDAVASACVDAGGSAIGMPQLCGDWIWNQVFWLVITLVVIYFVLAKIALPRIASVLAERQGTITNNLAAAEDLKRRAEEAEQAYEKALADAKAEAQSIAQKTRDEVKADIAKALEKADEEIAAKTAESEKAIADIRASAMEHVDTVAKEAAEAIIAAFGGKADEKAIADAVSAKVKG